MTVKCILAVGLLALATAVIAIVFFPASEMKTSSNEAIATEALRLSGIAQDRNLTVGDFDTLAQLAKPNPTLAHETEEAIWMVEHELFHHVNHALNAIISIAQTGEYSCPADSLSHVRPYLDFNETEKAQHVVEEGKEALPKWIAKVEAARESNPETYPDAEKLIEEMNATIDAFESDDMNAAHLHSAYLEESGYC